MGETVIVGAGLAGSLLAILLGNSGRQVVLVERRKDPRRGNAEAGRSINLAISARGLHALAQAGLEAEVLEQALPMRGRMIHAQSGETTFQPYGAFGEAINSVSRAGLNCILLDAAEALPSVRLVFGQRCTGVDVDGGAVTFTDVDTGATRTEQAELVIGADGAFSAVRAQLQRRERFDYSQSYLAHGYKELYIPPKDGGGFRLPENALHIWPRGGFMMIALPNADGSFTCTLFWAFEGDNSFANLRGADDVERFFRDTYPDAVPLMPTLRDDFMKNPTSALVTVRCGPWYAGRAVLVGDAAHAVVPFYGQGANAAFEDCVVLAECLTRHQDRAAAFAEYYSRRKEHADAIADLALANFIEMRDRVASTTFLLGKKVEKVLHRLFPRWYLPLYTMVSFTRIPYADAVRRAARQTRVVKAATLLLTASALVLAYVFSGVP